MFSGPTEAIAAPAAVRPPPLASSWLKRLLPRGLFGRSLLILVTPLVLVQVIATWVFYDRHWDTVSRRLAGSVAGDIALVIDAASLRDPAGRDWLFYQAGNETEIDFYFRPGATLAPETSGGFGSSDQLAQALAERVHRPFRIGPAPDPKDVKVSVQLPDGVLDAHAPRKRLYT